MEVLEVKMIAITCKCAGVYTINEAFYARCQEEGLSWTCPYCSTGWGFKGRGRADILAKEKADLESQLRNEVWMRENAEAAKLKATRKAASLEAERKKERLRVHNGVCPCCSRTFAALGRHMSMKHPDYRL